MSYDFSFRTITPPVGEPLSLNQAKDHLRIDLDLTEEDEKIGLYISSARRFLEDTYNIRFVRQTVELMLDTFPREDRIKLPIWPVQSVSYFRYTDVANVTKTLTEGPGFATRLFRKPAELVLPYGQVWPGVVLNVADPIRVGLVVGFGFGDSPETLPVNEAAMQALKLMVDNFYELNAAAVQGSLEVTSKVVYGVEALMSNVRLF